MECLIRGNNGATLRRPDPKPEEIAVMCLRIQSEWTEIERYRRRGGKHFTGDHVR